MSINRNRDFYQRFMYESGGKYYNTYTPEQVEAFDDDAGTIIRNTLQMFSDHIENGKCRRCIGNLDLNNHRDFINSLKWDDNDPNYDAKIISLLHKMKELSNLDLVSIINHISRWDTPDEPNLFMLNCAGKNCNRYVLFRAMQVLMAFFDYEFVRAYTVTEYIIRDNYFCNLANGEYFTADYNCIYYAAHYDKMIASKFGVIVKGKNQFFNFLRALDYTVENI